MWKMFQRSFFFFFFKSMKCSQCTKKSYASESIHLFQLIPLNLSAAVHGKFAELQGGLSAVTDQWTNKLGCVKMMLREAVGWGRGCCSLCVGEWMMPGATCTARTSQAESRPDSSHSACLCDRVPVSGPGITGHSRQGFLLFNAISPSSSSSSCLSSSCPGSVRGGRFSQTVVKICLKWPLWWHRIYF